MTSPTYTPPTLGLSALWNGAQFFNNEGKPLNGGKIFTYQAGSFTTQQTTYTTLTGDVENSNPIVLDSSGRVVSSIWLDVSKAYNLVLTLPDGVTVLKSVDGVTGILRGTP